MTRKRSTRAGREPRDIVMNGVTVVQVVASEAPAATLDEIRAAEREQYPERFDAEGNYIEEAAASETPSLEQIKGMSEALAAADTLDDALVIVGRSGEPLDDEFMQNLARQDPQLAKQFEAFEQAIDASTVPQPAAQFDPEEEGTRAAEEAEAAFDEQQEQEPVIERKSNGRALPDAPEANDDALAAAVKLARQEELPLKPIGLYVAQPAETRRDSELLTTVAHLVVPAQPSGLPLIGTFAAAACGATLFVDKVRVTSADFEGDADVIKCGWCLKVEYGEEIPPFDRGKRRPVLPGRLSDAPKARSRTRVSAEAGELMQDPAFTEALSRLGVALERMEGDEKWVPTAEEIAALRADLLLIQDANSRRNELVQTQRTERTEAARAPRSVGPRAPRPSSEGEGTGLFELRVSGKLAPTLFRSMDPYGPFVIGYRSAAGPHWIVRDVRVIDGRNPDIDFGADKAGAMRYAQEECAKLSPDVQAEGRERALKRIQAGDANRRCR